MNAGFLEAVIEGLLDFFPNGITIRFDNHAASHIGLFGQISFDNKFIIPF